MSPNNFSPAPGTVPDANSRIFGVAVGVVTNNVDPSSLGRVKVQIPELWAAQESGWCRLATVMACKERGCFFLPEVGDQVLVAFEYGDPSRPFVLGALWDSSNRPPETNSDGDNNRRLICSRSGMRILFEDKLGGEKIEISDGGGNNRLVIEGAGKKIRLSSDGDIEIVAKRGMVSIDAKTVKVTSSDTTGIEAG